MQEQKSVISCELAVDSLRRPTAPANPIEAQLVQAAVDATVTIAGFQLKDMGLGAAAAWGAFRPAIFGYAYGLARGIVSQMQVPHLEATACLQATSRLVHGEAAGAPVARVNELANCFEREDASFFAAIEAGEQDGAHWRDCSASQGLMTTLARSARYTCDSRDRSLQQWRPFAGAMARVAVFAAVIAGVTSVITSGAPKDERQRASASSQGITQVGQVGQVGQARPTTSR